MSKTKIETGNVILRPSQIADLIVKRTLNGMTRALMIEGPPGCGKTQVTAQCAKMLTESTGEEYGFIAVHAPTLNPEDCGLPAPNANRDGLVFLTPNATLPFENSDFPAKGILLIDELAQGDKATQKLLANLLQERNIHGNRLKAGWSIVCTGNRVRDRAGANQVLTHLRDRMTTVEMETNLDDWIAWFRKSPSFNPAVAAFVRFKPNLLSAFDPDQPKSPTPRAWAEGVSRIIGNVDGALEFACIQGDVGTGAANEFVAFLQVYRDLPDIDKLLKAPKKAPVPDKANVKFALATALGQRATMDNIGDILDYIDRLDPEFGLITVFDALDKCPDIEKTEPFAKWVVKNDKFIYA